jgi:hypothetical protein
MSKSKQVRIRALPNIYPQVAELMVKQLGIDTITLAYKSDRYLGIYDLIRPVLPRAIEDREAREIAELLKGMASEVNPPLPYAPNVDVDSLFLAE